MLLPMGNLAKYPLIERLSITLASSIVDLVIRARDQASTVFDRVGGALGGLGRSASGAGKGTESLTGAITGGIIQANLLGQALNMAGNAASFMMGKFEEAKKIELEAVSTAGNFAALTGDSFGESQKFVQSFNTEIAKIAGALPGATADYNKVANSIVDSVIPAFKDLNGSLDKEGLKNGLIDITKQMTLLGIQSGTNAGSVGMFTDRFLSGTSSLANLKQLEFGEKNAGFLKQIEEELKARGKTADDLKTLSEKERLGILQKVSSKFVSQEVIDAASNTVEGLTAGIESSLFDPTSGVFGLLRDLSADEGNQTVMSAVAGSIKAVMGFFDAGASILNALGIPSIDPMLEVYNGIQTFTGWINQASGVAKLIARTISGTGGGITGFQVAVEKFLDPKRLMEGVYYLSDVVFFWIDDGFARIAQITSSLFAGGKGMVDGFVIGEKIGAFVGDFLGEIATFIVDLPWGNILTSIGNVTLVLGSAAVGALWGLYTKSIEVSMSVWGQLGSGIVAAMNNLWVATSYTFKEWGSYFLSGWAEVGMFGISSAQGFFMGLGEDIKQMWERLKASIKGAIDGLLSQAQSFITNPLGGGATPLVATTGLGSTTNNAVGSTTNNAGQTNANSAPTSGFATGIANIIGSSFYKGHIPTAADGLIGALATESRNMPSGASPVIANSSEWILTPAQAQRLMQGAASVGSKSQSPINISQSLNFYGVSDPKAIATEVLGQLETLFSSYQQGVLA